jgi:hypothetical protein
MPPTAEQVLSLGQTIGEPLSPELREHMRRRLGFDPVRVRVHRGETVHHAARTLGAAAFTLGEHVFFARGRFAPETPEGRDLIAHELVHVRQQADRRPFRHGELTPARRAALETEARGAAAQVQAPARLVLAPVAGATSPQAPAIPLLADEAPTPPATAAAPTPPSEPPPGATPAPPQVDERAIAERVVRLFEHDLRLQRERTGVQQWHH